MLVSQGCWDSNHRPCSLKQQLCVVSWSWGWKSKITVSAGLVSTEGCAGESVPDLFPSSGHLKIWGRGAGRSRGFVLATGQRLGECDDERWDKSDAVRLLLEARMRKVSLGQKEDHVPGNWRKADAVLCASGRAGTMSTGIPVRHVSKYEGSDVTVPLWGQLQAQQGGRRVGAAPGRNYRV